jgi:hypothetical protein
MRQSHSAFRAAAIFMAVGAVGSGAALAQTPLTVLVDFGNASTFRGVSVPSPDARGNTWNSVSTGQFVPGLLNRAGSATTVAFGFDTSAAVATDSFNGPAGATSNPVTTAQLAAVDIDTAALGNLGVPEAAIDYVVSNAPATGNRSRFQLQGLDPTQQYTLSFFGSHKFSNVDTTTFSVYPSNAWATPTATASVNVQTPGSPWLHNRDSVATIAGISPASNTIFYVDFGGVGAATGNFGYLNSLQITNVLPSYTGTGDGSFNTAANWANALPGMPVPNGVGVGVFLGDTLTANSTVTASTDLTLGRLDIDAFYRYTVAGTNTLTLQGTQGSARVRVLGGNHTIGMPISVASNTTVSTNVNSSLTLTSPTTLAAGTTLTKSGAGKLTINRLSGAGALRVSAGTLAIAPGAGVSVVEGLELVSGATLDLANNAMVVNYTGASPLSGVLAAVVAGYAGQTWTGAGINSSTNASDTSGRFGIGVAEASSVGAAGGTWLGQTVGASAILIRTTLRGDANLDGAVDFSDLLSLAQNYNSPAAGLGWREGDFSYDGQINFSDLLALAQNYSQSITGSFAGDWSLAQVSVPEPTSLLAVVGCLAGALQRRRRDCFAPAARD